MTQTSKNEPERPNDEAARLEWVRNVFATADKLDLESYVNSFAEDGSFQAGNEPPSVGREAIRAGGGRILSAVKAMRHDILHIWLEKDAAIVEAHVNYTRKQDDKTVIVPCVTILRTAGDRIKNAKIFMDISPVFAD